jgi:adenylate cyclase
VLTHQNLTLMLDHGRPEITIGRDAACDLVVHEKLASRVHVSIRLLRTHFYLLDSSLNGTFVTRESGEEVHVLRGELLLDGAGHLTLGRSVREGATEVIAFRRDRRSIYRI